MATICLHTKGILIDLNRPIVMAIVNITPDSFYAPSRAQDELSLLKHIETSLAQGATIIDIGGCSTRPGSQPPTIEQEWQRVHLAITLIKTHFPQTIISIDTYRSEIVKRAYQIGGIDIINDISGGQFDADMFNTAAQLHLPYILTHTKALPIEMQQHTLYNDMMSDLVAYYQQRVDQLHRMGCSDIILDPGFGFSKSPDQNYHLLHHLNELHIFELPILVGISRKSMLTKLLNIDSSEALNATTAAHMVALIQGSNILRVHDVKPAIEAITIYNKIYNN